MILLISLAIIIIDQIIKAIVTINIPLGTTIGKGIRITNIANTGMAYSMRSKQTDHYNNCKHCNHMYTIIFSNKKLQEHK